MVDIGSKHCRIGVSGDSKPQHELISRTLSNVDVQGSNHFMERGLVSDWSQLESVWSSIYSKAGAASQETPLLLADSPSVKDGDREQMAEILFEKFSVPHYFVCNQGILSLYSCGRTSGLIIDSGYGATHAMAIHEGYAYPHTIERMEIGGADIGVCLENMLRDRGIETGTLDMDAIHEQVSHVSLDFSQESLRLRMHPEEQPTLTLPDGNTVALLDEHIRCGEALFEPGLVGAPGDGLSERLWQIVRVCDSDKEGGPMRSLPSCLLLSGGLSQMPGLVPRVRADLERRSAASRGHFIAALPQDDARHAAWIGGSILGSLPGFAENNFVSLAEYREFGAAAVHRRC